MSYNVVQMFASEQFSHNFTIYMPKVRSVIFAGSGVELTVAHRSHNEEIHEPVVLRWPKTLVTGFRRNYRRSQQCLIRRPGLPWPPLIIDGTTPLLIVSLMRDCQHCSGRDTKLVFMFLIMYD